MKKKRSKQKLLQVTISLKKTIYARECGIILIAMIWHLSRHNKSLANSSLPHYITSVHNTDINLLLSQKSKAYDRVYMIFVAARSNFEMRTVQLPHPP